ncbi:hypothetical protein CRP2_gp49 [Roseobacter phage CRP-2]|nr:hypothetical protein CRP2_gp49 [Roseobacter phage CRP-2]
MAQDITIQLTSDGKTTVTFPGGGQQTVGGSTADAVKALKAAYGDRVAGVVSTDKTLAEITAEQQAERQSYRTKAVDFVEQGSGYYGEAGGATGYSEDDIQRYINSSANQAGPGYTSVQDYIDATLDRSDRLASKYFDPNEWNTFTDKQKLAAIELFHQGNGDTGRTNGLSAKDIEWVKNEANTFKGIVASPNTQAISTGFDPVINQTTSTIKKPTVPAVDTGPIATDSSVAGGGFTSVTPPTEVIELSPGEVPSINPNVSQTVTQQVAPVTYQDRTQTVAPVQAGTIAQPLQTAGLSAVPSQVTYKTQYAGTSGAVPQTLVTTAPGMGTTYDAGQTGYQTVTYGNDVGQRIPVTEFNGTPTTYVPPGFRPIEEIEQQQAATQSAVGQDGTVQAARGAYISGYNKGGDIELEGKYRIYTKQFGYTGPKTREAIEQFEEARPEVKRKGMAIGGYVRKFNRGGVVRGFDEGGLTQEQLAKMQASAVTQTMQPMQATTAMIQPTAAEFIPVDAGMTAPIAPFAEAATVGTVQQATMPTAMTPATAGVTTATPQVQEVTQAMQPVTGVVSPEAQVTAAQQQQTSVSGMEAAQGTAIMMNNPVQREIQEGELISGAANAEKASQYAEEIQAATATPTKQATVAGQLEGLMQQFEGGETPAWAAGSMRTAMQTLSARGLGASSLAGQAVIQAAMEAALPIAQMDAQTMAQFEAQNLSNRQQRQMLAAQQRATFLGQEFDQAFQARVANSARIGDIANMNFTAEQQVALENSRAANTVNLNNLSNRQAMVMAEAAALSQLDMANLNNRQQAAVQNAQNFLQMDMQNLSNEQQTAMFKAQQNIQALFTDQAAENAAAQFNAQSENQTNQFFANLSNQTAQFNATQQNAMDQFNVNSVNALREFNSELQQQRDMFNAQNGLVIAQSNAQWRQNIATLNTATQNQSNMDFAKTINGLTAANMDQIWQRERDIMSFAFGAAESAANRASQIAIAKLTADEQAKLQDSIGQGKLAAIALDAVLGKWL